MIKTNYKLLAQRIITQNVSKRFENNMLGLEQQLICSVPV